MLIIDRRRENSFESKIFLRQKNKNIRGSPLSIYFFFIIVLSLVFENYINQKEKGETFFYLFKKLPLLKTPNDVNVKLFKIFEFKYLCFMFEFSRRFTSVSQN